ncbi:helix-turn-helix transcriptional regulator [Glutamicibacter sp. NPDC087344]|uniref:helix-turn-helix transcriptional regulator n=1 Tax=Glutamicibacter sp. NPDC087344 TaxID=3363994 RepID=UPI0037FC5794
MSTSTRALELLGLLQSRRHWPGSELARRLKVSPRTLRRDVNNLQDLGYPISTTRGTGGGYQLSAGGSLPPLVLSEEEAAAIVLGLKEVASGIHPTSADAAVSAMAKIVQVLPARIRRRIDSLRSLASAPVTIQSAVITDIAALTTVALACRDHETLKFTYRTPRGQVTERMVQPHRTVSVDYRLYLIGWDLDRSDWRTFRIDRIEDPVRKGKQFAPRGLPGDDPVQYIQSQINSLPAKYPIRATVQASAHVVKQEVGHHGSVEQIDATTCEVYIPAESLDWAAFCLASIGAPFVVHGPPEVIDYLRGWGERLTDATRAPTRTLEKET